VHLGVAATAHVIHVRLVYRDGRSRQLA
jgi:hypothetical protein